MNLAECAGGLICCTGCRQVVGRTLALVVTLLMFSGSLPTLSLDDSDIRYTEGQFSEANLVTWKVGDTWAFDIELDAVLLVEDSPDLAGSSLDLSNIVIFLDDLQLFCYLSLIEVI